MSSREAIFRIVTPQDVAGTSSSANSGPGFLFVECNGQDGRIESRVRPLVNRHVMLNHVFREVGDDIPRADEIGGPVGAAVERQTGSLCTRGAIKKEQPRTFTFVTGRNASKHATKVKTRPRVVLSKSEDNQTRLNHLARITCPSSPLSPTPALENVCQWWFNARSDLRGSFDVAKTHWVESAWNMARRSDTVYECVALYAARKKAQTYGVWSDYMLQEARCIRSMSKEIQKPTTGPRPLLPVAIGVLAYLALLDRRVDVAITHLKAIKTLWGPYSFKHTRQEWVYVVWLDLRFAMHLGRAPILEYFLPMCFRDMSNPSLPFDVDLVAKDKAEFCARRCPSSGELESSMTVRLFDGIFHLFLSWPALRTAEQTPFGRVYDLDFWLCTLRSQVLPLSEPGSLSAAMYVELLLATMQVHVWIVTRFWAPIGTASRQALLTRACSLIKSSSAEAFVNGWEARADGSSLLWVLSTVTACSIEVGVDVSTVPLEELRLTIDRSEIGNVEQFFASLKQWPWMENWHEVKYEKLWDLIDNRAGSALDAELAGLRTSARPTILGGLEFYDE